VEDDQDIHDLVVSVLTDEGYNVHSSYDGLAGVQLLKQNQPPPDHFCLVLLDMMMPNLDGVGVLRCLTQCGQYVPIVAMSASTEWLGKAKQAGATATLKKPFDLDDLLKAVARYRMRL
jgi:two-component system, chemotaxis family, chemotaxis protein CheY